MKIAILSALILVALLLAAILVLLFLPGASYQATPTPRAQQAAVGRAVLTAAQNDPAVAAMVRSAVQASSDEDRALASELIAALSKQ